ncbi:MAG: 2-oxoglutarate dehydrogenase, E2 component, dihydrolipoamide succinyltransferase [Corynebacterium sp.]|nr:2-oxoglutarate dehydrogenase, E2 component, dihydrolipoamide succinyltransferase [Corynebacterium sp.]
MSTSVEMPELGESVTEGTITTWLKKVGDTVEVDEPLLEVSTDKVDTEIPSPVAGTILEIRAEEDETVDVGTVIAVIGEAGETPAASAPAQEAPAPAAAEAPAPEPQQAAPAAAEAPAPEPQQAAPAGGGAATDVEMPELGESVTEGTITTWLKKVGDHVDMDEPLLEVSTDKVDTEIPSPVAGTVVEILAQEDETVDVGTVIARIGDGSAAPAPEPKQEAPAAPAPEPKAEPAPAAPAPKPAAAPAPATANSGQYVTPLVRKLAREYNVDLSQVSGTGIGGRIRKQDVMAVVNGDGTAAAAPAARESAKGVDPAKAALRGTTQKVNRIRQITAAKTRESLATTAQLTQVHEVDMTKVWDLRAQTKEAFKEKYGINLTFLPFFAKAAVEALVAHPNVNASYNPETTEMTYHGQVNLAIAVDTEQGLLSPVIHNAQDLSLPELAQAIVDIADRARTSKLKPNDLVGGTFTITNIGSNGALTDTPILVPPQAAMIGTGAITKRPVVVNENGVDGIAIRNMVFLPMTYDHQVVDGADAGRFMTTVRDRLETGNFEADLDL